jgi:hypothetical protein
MSSYGAFTDTLSAHSCFFQLCNACDAPEITFDPENNFVATVSGDTTGTAQQLSPGACGQGGNNQGLWYKFRANGHYM